MLQDEDRLLHPNIGTELLVCLLAKAALCGERLPAVVRYGNRALSTSVCEYGRMPSVALCKVGPRS